MGSLDRVGEVARALREIAESGSHDALADLCADDVVYWNNITCTEQTMDKLLRFARTEEEHLLDRRAEDLRMDVADWGVVQRMIIRGHTPLGDEIAIPMCAVFTVTDGVVTRIDEYLNVEHARPLYKSMFGSPELPKSRRTDATV